MQILRLQSTHLQAQNWCTPPCTMLLGNPVFTETCNCCNLILIIVNDKEITKFTVVFPLFGAWMEHEKNPTFCWCYTSNGFKRTIGCANTEVHSSLLCLEFQHLLFRMTLLGCHDRQDVLDRSASWIWVDSWTLYSEWTWMNNLLHVKTTDYGRKDGQHPEFALPVCPWILVLDGTCPTPILAALATHFPNGPIFWNQRGHGRSIQVQVAFPICQHLPGLCSILLRFTFEHSRSCGKSRLCSIFMCILHTQYGFWLRHLLSLVPESLSFGRVVACALCDTAAHQCVCAWRMWSLHGLGESTRVVPLSALSRVSLRFTTSQLLVWFSFRNSGLHGYPVPRSPRFWGDMTPGPRSQDVPWLNGFGRAAGSSAPSGFCGSAPRQGSAPSNHQGRRGSGRRRHAPCAAGRDPAVSHGISISGSRMLEGRLWSASVSYLFQFDPLYPLFDLGNEPHTLKLGISCWSYIINHSGVFCSGNRQPFRKSYILHDLYRILHIIILYPTEVKEIHRQSPPHCLLHQKMVSFQV